MVDTHITDFTSHVEVLGFDSKIFHKLSVFFIKNYLTKSVHIIESVLFLPACSLSSLLSSDLVSSFSSSS